MRLKSRGTKTFGVFAALLLSASFALAACGKKSSGSSLSTPCNNAAPTKAPVPKSPAPIPYSKVPAGGTVNYAIDQENSGWNVNTATDNQADLGYMTQVVYPQPFVNAPDYKVSVNHDYLTSAKETKKNPQTVVLKINPKATWSDGVPINADDFIYNWQMQKGTDPTIDVASPTGYNQIKSITGSDNGKTVTIVFSKPFPDWQSLFSNMLPQHIYKDAKGWGTVDKAGNASGPLHGGPPPTVSGGPFKFTNYTAHKEVDLVPNDKWWGQKPKLKKIIVTYGTDPSQLAPAFQNGEVQFAYPQPQLSFVTQLKGVQDARDIVNFGLSWEHIDFNMANPELAKLPVRQAIYYGLNRQQLVQKTVGQFSNKASVLNNRMFVTNQPEYESHAPSCMSDGPQKAMDTLKKAGFKLGKGSNAVWTDPKTGKPLSFTIKTTSANQLREDTEKNIIQQLQKIHIKLRIANEPPDTVFSTISAQKYDIALFAWVDTPYVTGNVSIYKSASKGGGQNWTDLNDPQINKLMDQVATAPSRAAAAKIANQADKLLWKKLATIPLYQKPTVAIYNKNLVNVVDNPTTQGPLWNATEWGLKK